MIYLGDNWPDRYRNGVFTCNLHGHRINHDRLETKGSGTVARHERDFLMANDDWFRGLELKYGPDGGVYLTDWSDTGECHETDGDLSHRENGRIYKITYGDPKPVSVDLTKDSDETLAKLQTHKNDWFVRTARRILQERAASGKDMAGAHRVLRETFETNPEVTRKLRAMWALHVTGGLDREALTKALDHPEEHVRNWAVRFVSEGENPASSASKFAEMAKADKSAHVRLALASAIQRLPVPARWGIAEGLSSHGEDSDDLALPLMIWYGTEALIADDVTRAVDLTTTAKIPLIRRYLARRAISWDERASDHVTISNMAKTRGRVLGYSALIKALDRTDDPSYRGDVLAGMLDALRGQRSAPMPEGWPALSARLLKSPELSVREPAMLLSLLFGDAKARETVQSLVADAATPADERTRALQALVQARVPGLAAKIHPLLDQRAMRGPALRALAAVGDEASPRLILDRYASFSEADRTDAIATLSARVATAKLLVDALEKGTIPRRDISATTARQLLAFNDRDLSARLERAWGALRPASAEKAAQMAKIKDLLAASSSSNTDRSRGRSVFNRSCAQCHKLFDAGGDVGPDLTGSGRADLSYILENVLDPSSAVAQDYRLTTVATTDGRVISGIVRARDAKAVTLQTPNERVIVPVSEIEAEKTSPESMMPEGLFDKLSPSEIRDLIAYLAGKSQVDLPEGAARD
jgi:putative heme-binding domain-containing protein